MMCEPSQKKLSEAMALESGAAPNATLSPFWTDKRRASFKEAIKIGVKATSSLCEGLVEVLPFPGGPCAALLGQVALLVSTAMANHDNLKALQEMAAELMDVIIEKHVRKVDQAANQGGSRAAKAGSRMYYQLMARFRDLLDGILAYTKDYNNKNFIVKLLMTGHAREQYQEMVDNLAKLLANAHFSVSVDTHSLVTNVQSMTAEMKGMVEDIRRRTQYTDRSSEVKHLVDELGGYDAVASSDAKLNEVVKHLDSGQQIEIAVLKKQARAGLMALEAAQEEGVHSLVKHADMRTFWRMCFKGLPKVDWEVWWEAFPSQLMVVVQDKVVVEQVAARLSTDADLRRFQEFVEKRDGETISVKEVNDAFPSGISISMAVDRALGLQEDGVSKATTTSGNAEAKVLCEESLASRQRSMGPNHPSGTASAGGSSISSGGMPPTMANVEANNNSAMAYLQQDTMSQLGGNFAAVGGGGGSAGVSPLQALSRQDEGEMRKDFNVCLQKLAAGDVEEAVQVMELFCYELMDQGSSNGAPVAALFQANMDQVISILTQRSDEIFASAYDAAARQEPANSRACKYALNTLMNVFQSPALGQVISKHTLRPLMSVLLCCLVDEMVGMLPEGMAMLKALNLLMMKILENSDRTAVFQALMELLLAPHHRLFYAPNSAKAEQGWYDLVVKCMIKITNNLPATVDSINIQAVLLSVHSFFDALGGEEIRKRGAREDKPLRMVKTVLHELCKLKGASIYSYTRDIPGADLDPALKPIIFPYIDLNLQTLAPEFMRSGIPAPQQPLPRPPQQPHEAFAGANASPRPPSGAAILSRHTSSSSLNLDAAGPRASTDGVPAAQPPQQQQQQQPEQVAQGSMVLAPSAEVYCQRVADDPAARSLLSVIFKRIAENSADRHQALVDLYFFTAANPGQDIEAMLGAASPTFKNFIVRGLHKVRQQAQWQAQQLQQQGQAPGIPQAHPHASQPAHAPALASSCAHTHTHGHSRNSSSSSSSAANAGINTNGSASNAFGADASGLSSSMYSPLGSANAQGSGAAAAAASAAGAPPDKGLAAARLAMAAADSGSAGAPPSPVSPSGNLKAPRAAPVVGEDKIAELRDRMHRMQLDMQSMPQRSATGPTMAAITAAANPSASYAGAPASPSPLSATSRIGSAGAYSRADNGGSSSYGGEAQGEGYTAGAAEGGGAGAGGGAEGNGASDAPGYGDAYQQQQSGGSGSSSMATLQERMRRLRELEGQ